MQKKLKNTPKFNNEDEERAFWAKHDSSEYVDWDNADTSVFPRLKPSTRKISLRLSESMFNEIQVLANKMDVPYQSLIKMFLKERIDMELKQSGIPRQTGNQTAE